MTTLRGGDDASLAGALERNFGDLQALYARGAGGRVRDTGDVRFSASGRPSRILNAVNLARLTPETTADRIAEAIAFFAPFGVPFRWLVGVTTTPVDLPARLEAAGLVAISNSPGMAVSFGDLVTERVDQPGLEIAEIAGAEDLDAWIEVCLQSFPLGGSDAAAWRTAHEALGWGADLPLRNVVARLDGRPVAVSAAFLNGEVTGIFNVGTLADVRGRGIGRAVTQAAIGIGREAGYHVAILGSSPMGVPVYRRLGFREVCRNRHFGPA